VYKYNFSAVTCNKKKKTYISDPFHLKDYTQFNEIEDKLTTPVKRIEMAWKPNYDVVAIGNSNGYFYIIKVHLFQDSFYILILL